MTPKNLSRLFLRKRRCLQISMLFERVWGLVSAAGSAETAMICSFPSSNAVLILLNPSIAPRSGFLNISPLPIGTISSNFSLYFLITSLVFYSWFAMSGLMLAARYDKFSINFCRRLSHDVFNFVLSAMPLDNTLSFLVIFAWLFSLRISVLLFLGNSGKSWF